MAEPLGIADSATSLIMELMSQVGGKLDVKDPEGCLDTIPPSHLESAQKYRTLLGTYSVSGCWFTHTRLYRTARAFGEVRTGTGLAAGADKADEEKRRGQAREVQESKLVGAQLPFRMTFQVISYTLTAQALEVAAQSTAAKANQGLSAVAHAETLKVIERQIREVKKGSPAHATLVAEKNSLEREFAAESKQLAKLAKTGMDRADAIASLPPRYAITNFRLVSTGGEDLGVEKYASSGISVDGALRAVPIPGFWMEVGLKWNERGLPFYHKSWEGDLLIKLNDDGFPVVASYGSNKFFDRFHATMTGIKPIDEGRMHGDGSVAAAESLERMRQDRDERQRRTERRAEAALVREGEEAAAVLKEHEKRTKEKREEARAVEETAARRRARAKEASANDRSSQRSKHHHRGDDDDRRPRGRVRFDEAESSSHRRPRHRDS